MPSSAAEKIAREAAMTGTIHLTSRSLVVAIAILAAGNRASALDQIRVAKGGLSLIFTLIDVGQMAKIWEANGLEIQSIQTDGQAPMDKAMISGDVDIAL